MAKKKKEFQFLTAKMLVGALSLFVIALSSSIAATYAYYLVRDFARVEQLNIGLADTGHLRIGLEDGEGNVEYGSKVGPEQLRKANADYDKNTYLQEVSSMFSSAWLQDESVPAAEKVPLLRKPYSESTSDTMTEAAEGGYLQYALHFICDEPCHLYLDASTKAEVLERWNKNLAAQYGYSEEELNRVLDCVRVSFYSEQVFAIAEPGQEEASHTRFGGPLQARNDKGYFDDREGKEILYGEYEGTPTYSPALDQDSEIPTNPSAFDAIHKAGVERVNPESVTYAYEESHPLSAFLHQGGPSAGGAICLGTLQKDVDYRLVVSVYIEGWDLDLTDSLATGKFSLDLQFTGLLDI